MNKGCVWRLLGSLEKSLSGGRRRRKRGERRGRGEGTGSRRGGRGGRGGRERERGGKREEKQSRQMRKNGRGRGGGHCQKRQSSWRVKVLYPRNKNRLLFNTKGNEEGRLCS